MKLLARGLDLDAAVLDVNLSDGESYAVADVIVARRVPFVWATGYDRVSIPTRFSDVHRCEKPVALQQIVEALRA